MRCPSVTPIVAPVQMARIWLAGRAAVSVVLIAGSLVGAGCGGSPAASSKSPSLPSPSPTPGSSPPPGGPVPTQLQGDWFFHRDDGWVHLPPNGARYVLSGIA